MKAHSYSEPNDQHENLFPAGNENDVETGFDPCEEARGRDNHYEYGMTTEERAEYMTETSEEFYEMDFGPNDEEISASNFSTPEYVSADEIEERNGRLNLNCHKTVEYFYRRDMAAAESIEVIEQMEVSPYLRVISQGKYHQGGNKKKASPRVRYMLAG